MNRCKSGRKAFLCYRKSMLLSVLAGLTLPLASAPALAQDAQGENTVDTVVVTATRRETSVLEVPYNISVVSAADLEKAAVGDFSDLTKLVPGVAYIDTGNRNAGNASTFILRGVNADATSANADYSTQRAPTVSTYLNETPLFFEMNLSDIERVEVLRGPQGTLYGSGAVGGTVKVITRKPQLNVFEATLAGEAFDTKRGERSYGLSGIVNVPVGESVALRGAVNYDNNGGFIDSPNLRALDANGASLPADAANPIGSAPLLAPRNNANDSKSLSARGAVRFEVGEAVSAVLSHHYQNDKGVGRQAIHPTLGDGDDLYNAIEEPFERTVNVTALEAQVDFGFATLTSATSVYEIDTDVTSDFSDQISTNYAQKYYYNTYPRLIGRERDRFKDKVFTQELRLASPGGAFVDWIGGVYYQKIKHRTDGQLMFPGVAAFNALPGQGPATQLFNSNTGEPLASDLIFTETSRWTNEELALFGEVTLNLSERWQVTGGARVFDNKFQVSANQVYLGAPDPRAAKSDVSDSIFKLNTSYKLTDEHSAYATWAQGFRRGGANALSPFDPPEFGTYEPDTADNYEVGLKGTLADRRIQYTLAAFLIDWDNVQVSSYTDFGTAVVANGAGARNKGFELEASGRLLSNLRFTGGYTFVDAKTNGAFTLNDTTAPDGARLPGVPRHMAAISLDYEHPLEAWNDAALELHLGGSYRSKTESSFGDEPFSIKGFSIWNVSASLVREEQRLTLFVDNLFDDAGVTGGIGDTLGPLGQYRYIARPRTMGVRFSVNWGG